MPRIPDIIRLRTLGETMSVLPPESSFEFRRLLRSAPARPRAKHAGVRLLELTEKFGSQRFFRQ
jgi:hypothetical protein